MTVYFQAFTPMEVAKQILQRIEQGEPHAPEQLLLAVLRRAFRMPAQADR